MQKLTDYYLLAQTVCNRAYAPYSHFHVGCVLVGEDGNTYCGCNVENAAYPQSQCAEATAVGNLVSSGCRKIQSIILYAPTETFCWPCGGCRQRLWEFASQETPVISYNQAGKSQTRLLGDLLPDSFGPSNLGKK